MSDIIWRPCVYGHTWPELFAQLPDDQARHNVSQTLADSRLEGRDHARDDVSDLIDYVLGRISAEQKTARLLQRLRADRAATA